jgi:hypothetical protein
MDISSNPFTVLSYVSGPALLTNATGLMLLSTANRFARAVDRSRELVQYLEGPDGSRSKMAAAEELISCQERVRLIGRALARFYLAASVFALATMSSIAGAVLGQSTGGLGFDAIIVFAVICGAVGFLAMVSASTSLMIESRLATKALDMEADEAMAAIDRVLKRRA